MSEAASVTDALTALNAAEQVFDWVLLDLMLPDGCGVQVIDALKAMNSPTRVCVITGCGKEMISLAHRAGADRTFTKPLCVEALIDLVAPASVA